MTTRADEYILTDTDRCDRCIQTARVRVVLLVNEQPKHFDLCAHDYRQHEAAIAATPGLLHVIDERDRLVSAP